MARLETLRSNSTKSSATEKQLRAWELESRMHIPRLQKDLKDDPQLKSYLDAANTIVLYIQGIIAKRFPGEAVWQPAIPKGTPTPLPLPTSLA